MEHWFVLLSQAWGRVGRTEQTDAWAGLHLGPLHTAKSLQMQCVCLCCMAEDLWLLRIFLCHGMLLICSTAPGYDFVTGLAF